MASERKIKCVVWDLDNTLWDGILAEGDTLRLRPEALNALKTFDERGILQSIASRNTHEAAWLQLEAFKLDHYFLYPQIHWNAKSGSLGAIAEKLNIGLDTFAFIDDQPFERDEVRCVHPAVRVFDAAETSGLPALPAFMPRFITEDSRRRRELYQLDANRNQAQAEFKGPEEKFLRTLDLRLALAPAGESDLQRAEELTQRTNQLNTTGIPYSYETLRQRMLSPDHLLLIADLTDRYGDYGKIGLVLLHRTASAWTIELLLMSCRVMSRGVGGAILTFLRRTCAENGCELYARFRETERNRMMYVTYRFAGFSEHGATPDGLQRFKNDLTSIPAYPDYLTLNLAPELQIHRSALRDGERINVPVWGDTPP